MRLVVSWLPGFPYWAGWGSRSLFQKQGAAPLREHIVATNSENCVLHHSLGLRGRPSITSSWLYRWKRLWTGFLPPGHHPPGRQLPRAPALPRFSTTQTLPPAPWHLSQWLSAGTALYSHLDRTLNPSAQNTCISQRIRNHAWPFMLVIDDFGTHTNSNETRHTSSSCCFSQTSRLRMCTWFYF